MTLIHKALVASFLITLVVFTGCSQKRAQVTTPKIPEAHASLKPTEISGWIMEMPYHVLIGDPISEEKKKDLEKVVLGVFSEIDLTFNKFNPNSELSKLNLLKAYEKAPISEPLADMLTFCKKIYVLSEGRFDPTVEKAMQLWKAALEKGHLLEDKPLKEAKACVGLDKVHIEEGVFYKSASGLAIDLGSVAKGHAIDLIAQRLQEKGVKSALINWSGELYAFGKHPEKRAWQVMIPAYVRKGSRLPLENQALATSGDYLQNWRVAVKDRVMTLCHILDPRSVKPMEIKPGSIAAVSVCAKSCMLADSLATSAMIFESAEKLDLWIEKVKAEFPDVCFWTLRRKETSHD